VAEVQQATKQGFPLTTTTTVTGSVSVEAVLIPPAVAKHVFGKTVADNYAVIALTISNRSAEATLIVHSIFIDYSRWILSGSSNADSCEESSPQPVKPGSDSQVPAPEAPKTPPAAQSNSSAIHVKCNPPQSWQAETTPSQIASAESRIVRGQLLDRQPWTTRNWVIRALQAAGSIAQAYTFTLSASHAIQSIGAFNGQIVPAAETFWPDSTIGQMNRISDMGFQVNKVIPKESSDIVVSFFPIDRFLTPGLKKLFISSPAIFFAPYSMILDKTARDKLAPLITPLFDSPEDAKAFMRKLPSAAVSSDKQTVSVMNFLNQASLNTVRVIVGGAMTIDVNNVPPAIDSVDIPASGGVSTADLLGKAGDVQGTIKGSFLTGGQPAIVEAGQLDISSVTAVTDGSTDKQLNFKMTKKNAQGATVESPTFDYQIPAAPPKSVAPSAAAPEKPVAPSAAPEKPVAPKAAPAKPAGPAAKPPT
jgi:hypothetical protein